jgi:PAS domain S-box-containing protein
VITPDPRSSEAPGVDAREDLGSEVQRLRTLIRDLISLLAQPAIETGLTPAGVVQTLVEVLLSMLRADLVYARVARPGEAPIEAASASACPDVAQRATWLGAALQSWLQAEASHTPITVENPLERGELRLLARRFGLEEGSGVAVGSRRQDFPTASEALLLQVAINQAVMGFQGAQLLQEHEHAERLAFEAASLRLFGRVVETSSDFIGMCSPEMKPIFLNEAGRRMVGLDSLEEVRRTTLMDYFWPDERPRIESEAIPTLVREGRWSGEVRFRHFKTGAPIPTMWNAFVIKDDAGAPVAWATVSPDLTALKEAEEALRDANARLILADRRKNEFLGVLSHELRNPLTPICSSIYVLDRVAPGSAEAARAKEIIQRQAAHLRRIVDDLLDVTRITRGKITLDRKRIDLRELVLRECEDHRSTFEEGRVELRHELPAGPAWIDADVTRLSQVLWNLLQNAAKFTPPCGTVVVGVRVRDGSAELSVRDTGVGMRPEEIGHIFEPFMQAAQGLARTQGGLGLGLALVKGLVELHGGLVEARSDGPGRGSGFCVLLPLAPAPAVGAAAAEAQEPAGGRRVLVIEDNADTCASLALALGMTGHEVRTACNGKTGIAEAHQHKPDVVLCDIGLPDIDGYEVARTLRADDALRSTRLIALSGYARPEDEARAREAGFDAHVSKPPDLDELTRILSQGGSGFRPRACG